MERSMLESWYLLLKKLLVDQIIKVSLLWWSYSLPSYVHMLTDWANGVTTGFSFIMKTVLLQFVLDAF